MMFQWPWVQRAHRAEIAARIAEEELHHTRALRPAIEAAAKEARRHRELNGWTETVKTIFGGGKA